jgi:NitT/TauT family transport system ATP-binding protein
LEGVSLSYEAGVVLSDVTIEIAPGEALCLVGPSGGGKSTILNLLAGLVKPTKGRVLFDGEPIEGPGPERAVVFQDAALFPWLTLEKNIAFPLEVAGVPAAERGERVDELLRLVHLSRFRGAYPHELSGGMRQRGAIARALSTRPRMILFDEPFAALDGQMRELLQGEVERIVRASRTTMVFVTHSIDEAVRLGDRVVLIGARPGRVIGEIHVDLARPRRGPKEGDVQAIRIAQRIAEEIRAEVEKVAREEADGAWGSTIGSDGGDPRRHLGRGN